MSQPVSYQQILRFLEDSFKNRPSHIDADAWAKSVETAVRVIMQDDLTEAASKITAAATPEYLVMSDLDGTVDLGSHVRLRGKTETGQSYIKRYGEWWYVQSGTNSNRWFLRSSNHKQPRTLPVSKVENIGLPKITALSVDYELVQVVQSATPFNYKKHHNASL